MKHAIVFLVLPINQAELLIYLFISFFPAASVARDYLVD